jgi:hypothetical protein
MADMEWYHAIELVRPHVVRILTPQGSGTGFLFSRSANGTVCGIATAAHVVDHAHYWEQPIRVQHEASGTVALLRPNERAILLDESHDTAAIAINSSALSLPDEPLSMIPGGRYLRVGNALGWLGFPAISSANLCFFSGRVSAWLQSTGAYLVDGVAINGVSGGPAFAILGDEMFIMGVVSAYIPNRATGETLPGLGIVRDVVQLQDLIEPIRSLDEAKAEETDPAEPPSPIPEPEPAVPSSARRVT